MPRDPFRLGAYAVVSAPGPSGACVLLVPKVTGPYEGRLDLPGGVVELYEDPADTLVRELREECGLAIESEQAELLAVRSVVFRHAEPTGETVLLHHVGVLSRIAYDEVPHVSAEPGEPDPEWVAVADAGRRHLTPFAWWALAQLGES
jgi:8-oxo-dGTP diphosphatase